MFVNYVLFLIKICIQYCGCSPSQFCGKIKDYGKKFYKLKNGKKILKKKINFMKFAPKRSASKWTSNKMGNAKKGYTKRAVTKWSRQKYVLP